MTSKTRRRAVVLAVLVLVLGLGAAALTWLASSRNSPVAQCASGASIDMAQLAAAARGDVAAVQVGKTPQVLPPLAFKDAAGVDRTLADFKGRVVLLNLWATWCVPCRLEMPALDALQGALGGPDFEVLAINMDSRENAKPREWLARNNISRLGFYADPPGKVFQTLRTASLASGLPTTLLIDRRGCLLGRLDGAAEWASEDAKNLVRAAIKVP